MQAPREDQDRTEFVERRRVEPVEPVRTERRVDTVERYATAGPTYNRRDLVHWGPVWAGLVGTFAMMVILGIIGLAAGLAVFNRAPTAQEVASASTIWGAAVLFLSFFIGAWLAGRISSARGGLAGFLLGTVLFFSGLVLALLVTALGVGGAVAASLSVFGLPSANLTQGQAASAAQNASLWTLVGLALAYIGSLLGAILGTSGHFTDEDLIVR